MTMMTTNSQFGLEDMEALLCEPSSPMADAMSSLFHHDQEQHRGGHLLEGATSPVSPFTSSSVSSSSSPPPFYSPPRSPPAFLFHGDKAGTESDPLSLPWLGQPGQLRCAQRVSDDSKGDEFGDLDWMAERVDLSEFDLDSLIGCSPTEESSSPEDLLASLDSPMELDSLQIPALSSLPPVCSPSIPPSTPTPVCSDPCVVSVVEPASPPPCVPEPQEELEIKSEPASPDPSVPVVDSPSSPAYIVDLGSGVDVPATEVKSVVASVVPQVQRLVLSLSPTRIVLLLAPKDEIGITTTTVATSTEVTHSSPPAPPTPRSSRSRPYPEPESKSHPSPPSVKVRSLPGTGGEERTTLKIVKNKKLKKMEQNKTAATRYRKKKRAEHEALATEHAMLERKNIELIEKVESMAREIEYMKELMDEVKLARMRKGVSIDP